MPDVRLTSKSDRLFRAVFIALVALVVASLSSCASDKDEASARGAGPVDLTALIASTTNAKLPRAPRDTDPLATTDGEVVHPRRTLPVYAAPGSRPFAKVPTQQLKNDTWLPVIGQRDGWTKVLLPSRPNGSTGWLKSSQLEQRESPYLIRVHVGSRRLKLVRDGAEVGSWSVAVGAAGTPTPAGRTFLLASIVDPGQDFSPLILPLGSHSDSLDSYGGGPGTVALHGWPDASVFGTAVSHGCVRVPADALEQLRQVPLGTLVIIDQQ